MKETVAIVFGTFAPLHQGHIDVIQKAKRSCDWAVVVVSGYAQDRGDQVGLHLEKRFRYIREAFADDELTRVVSLNEEGLPRYPHGWTVWLDRLWEIPELQEDQDYVFYVSEEEYAEELSKRGYQVALQKRTLPISATQIRQEPAKYWKFIAQPFRRHFTKKVLIMGSASNGKTTLAKDLARYYAAPVSLEYAREYQVANNVRDDELTSKDYYYLLLGQYAQTSDLIESAGNQGLVIADTNSLVTKAYYDYYKNPSWKEAEQVTFNHLYQSILAKEEWDLILFVEPTGNYVNDGFRDMTMADDQIRQDFSSHLEALRKEALSQVPLARLNGDYLANYEDAKAVIDEIYHN